MAKFPVNGKAFIVTGACPGLDKWSIGAAIVTKLLDGGANVLLADMNGNVQEFANKLGPRAFAMVGDVTDSTFRHSLITAPMEIWGLQPQGLITAAGITRDAFTVKPPKDGRPAVLASLDDIRLVLEVNLLAPYCLARELVAHLLNVGMLSAKDPTLKVVIGFISSIVAHGNAGQAGYSMAKAAYLGLIETLLQEWGKYGVHVAGLFPGFTDTQMVEKVPPKILELQLLRTRSHKLHDPCDVAKQWVAALEEAEETQVWCDYFNHGAKAIRGANARLMAY